jgi:hypothetical protein
MYIISLDSLFNIVDLFQNLELLALSHNLMIENA